jgi:hypothetical protein
VARSHGLADEIEASHREGPPRHDQTVVHIEPGPTAHVGPNPPRPERDPDHHSI